MLKYNEFTTLFDNYTHWMNKVIELNIFDNREEAEMYFIKFKSNEYYYISYALQKILKCNGFNLPLYYESSFKDEFNIIGKVDLLNFKEDIFLLNKNNLSYLFLNFKHTLTYANTSIEFHIDLDDNDNLIFKTIDDLIFRIFMEFINKNSIKKYEIINDMIKFILKSHEKRNIKFDVIFISYVFLIFIEKLYNSESVILNYDYRHNFEEVLQRKSLLENDIKTFYKFYKKIYSNDYLLLFKLNDLNKDSLNNFFNDIANTDYKWLIPYLNCTYTKKK